MSNTMPERATAPSPRRWAYITRTIFIAFAAWGIQTGCGSNDPADPGESEPCVTGETEEKSCPDGGKQTRVCTSGAWGAFSDCPADTGPCDNGDTREVECPDGTDGGLDTCQDEAWVQTQECTPTQVVECEDGTEDVACGPNDRGTRTEICTGGQIVDHGTCDDTDECEDGKTRSGECGTNGLVAQECVVGTWEDDGACVESCVDDDTSSISCGLNDQGTQDLLCVDGEWENDGTCDDPDDCTNGGSQRVDCEYGDFGYVTQRCNSGAWQGDTCTGTSISLSFFNGCAVHKDGHVLCWGVNSSGQLGVGHKDNVDDPIYVHNINNARQVVTGQSHACALTDNGDVYCWGSGTDGKLGDGTDTDRLTPTKVPSLSGVKQLAAGDAHTCALLSTNRVACWGNNYFGQLGVDSRTARWEPEEALNLIDVGSIHADSGTTCARKGSGLILFGTIPMTDVYCWGHNEDHRAGLLSSTEFVLVPAKLQTPFANVALSDGVFCGINAVPSLLGPNGFYSQSMKCMGQAAATQGDGDGDTAYTSFNSASLGYHGPGGNGSIQLSGGSSPLGGNMCARMPNDGHLECWGANARSSLGRGFDGKGTSSQTAEIATPEPLATRSVTYNPITQQQGVEVETVTQVRAFAAHNFAICIINSGGGIQCTGDFGNPSTSVGDTGSLIHLQNIPATPTP